jgi:Leucine-rich repeat (LRR) protein
VANAGVNQTTIAGSYAVFDPTKSTGSINWYEWQQDENNPEKVNILSDSKQSKDEWNVHKIVFTKEGVYKFRLIVKKDYNDVNGSEPDTLIITVNSNSNPKFEDLNLEAIIRAKLNKQVDEIDSNALLSLDSLSYAEVIPRQRISSLKGLENCKNLIFLSIGSQDISDISPLSSLTKLKFLWLDQNHKISDVTPLTELINLEELHLQSNLILDITPIKDLTQLRILELQNNEIKDISPLKNLHSLTMLYLSGAQFSDLEPLKYLLKINQLWLINCNINDISFLSNLVNIKNLHLAWNNITDITPIKNMTNLEWVALDKNNIIDISSLKDLQNLSYVRLWDNQIVDIKPLVDNPNVGKGDILALTGNPLNEKSLTEYIPALQARGVTVTW